MLPDEVAYVIIRVSQASTHEWVTELVDRHSAYGLQVSTVTAMLTHAGFEYRHVGDRSTRFPLLAVAFTSPNKIGVGRFGPQALRMAVRRVTPTEQ